MNKIDGGVPKEVPGCGGSTLGMLAGLFSLVVLVWRKSR